MDWTRASLVILSAAVAGIAGGCAPPSAAAPLSVDKVYPMLPDSVTAHAGSMAGEIVRMKVTQRVEAGSGRIVSPPRLSGRLFLQNVSADQAIRVTGANISYIDAQGRPIRSDNGLAEPSLALDSSSTIWARLKPGQNATELLDTEFPAEALKPEGLKEIRIRLELSNEPRAQVLNFPISIPAQ